MINSIEGTEKSVTDNREEKEMKDEESNTKKESHIEGRKEEKEAIKNEKDSILAAAIVNRHEHL